MFPTKGLTISAIVLCVSTVPTAAGEIDSSGSHVYDFIQLDSPCPGRDFPPRRLMTPFSNQDLLEGFPASFECAGFVGRNDRPRRRAKVRTDIAIWSYHADLPNSTWDVETLISDREKTNADGEWAFHHDFADRPSALDVFQRAASSGRDLVFIVTSQFTNGRTADFTDIECETEADTWNTVGDITSLAEGEEPFKSWLDEDYGAVAPWVKNPERWNYTPAADR